MPGSKIPSVGYKGVIIGIAFLAALVLFLRAPTNQANHALWQGFILVAAACGGIFLLAHGPAVVKEGWQYWLCFGVALIFVFTGLVNAPMAIAVLEPIFKGFYGLADKVLYGLNHPQFPAVLIYLVLALVFAVIALASMIIGAPFVILEWWGSKGGAGLVAEKVFYSLLLAFTFRCLVFPAVVLVVRPLWPAFAAVVHDVFIEMPDNAMARLTGGGRVVLRVRSKLELFIAIVAGALAVAAHFWSRQ